MVGGVAVVDGEQAVEWTSDKAAALSPSQPGGVSLALPSDWAVWLQPRPEAARGTPIGSAASLDDVNRGRRGERG